MKAFLKNILIPKLIQRKQNEGLTKKWLETELQICTSAIRPAYMVAALAQVAFFYLSRLRPSFEIEFALFHRLSVFIAMLIPVFCIHFRWLQAAKYEYAWYKALALLASLYFMVMQSIFYFKNPDSPIFYVFMVAVVTVGIVNIGPITSGIFYLLCSAIFVAIGFTLNNMEIWSDFASHLSYLVGCAVPVYFLSGRYKALAERTYLHWLEQGKLESERNTEKSVKDHLLIQFEKLLYPHQVNMMKSGSVLKETMPVGSGKAYVICFDIMGSSHVKHDQFNSSVQEFLTIANDLMRTNYDDRSLSCDAYRIKDTGDGFLCSVGFPFAPPPDLSAAETALDLCYKFFHAFDAVMSKLDYIRDISCISAIVHGDIETYFAAGGIESYDAAGRGIILATRYESIRKSFPKEFTEANSHTIVISKHVFENLSRNSRTRFNEIDLVTKEIKIRDEAEATHLYLHHIKVRQRKDSDKSHIKLAG